MARNHAPFPPNKGEESLSRFIGQTVHRTRRDEG
jgi:hypothetical protein